MDSVWLQLAMSLGQREASLLSVFKTVSLKAPGFLSRAETSWPSQLLHACPSAFPLSAQQLGLIATPLESSTKAEYGLDPTLAYFCG